MKSENDCNYKFESEDSNLSNLLHFKKQHIPWPTPGISYVLVVILRLEDFHLFKGLYGEYFSNTLQKQFEKTVHLALEDNQCGVINREISQVTSESGEHALIWYDERLPEEALDFAFSMRLAVQNELHDYIYQQTGQSIRVRVGQAEKYLPDNAAWEQYLFSCLADARNMIQNGFNMQDMFLNKEFQEILNHSKLSVVYQPIVNLSTGSIFGWEALSRGPECSNFHSPLFLFNFAEESGNLFQLERVCREKAIKNCVDLATGQKLFLNIHPQTLSDPEFTPGETKRILQKCGLDPGNVVFEITERHDIQEFKLFYKTLEHYRKQGFLIAVDDVGTGYSGLVSLARIRPDFIKIDKSLVFDFNRDPVKKALLETFVTFANKIEAKIIAEGIETHTSLKTLSDLGVHLGQGFYIAKPDFPPPNVDYSKELKSRLSIPESSHCNQPVKNFINSVYTVNEDTRVDQVHSMFETLGALASIVVQKNSVPIGLVMSHQLDRKLSTRYGAALYYSRNVNTIMDKNPLIVDEFQSIESVAQKAIVREGKKMYDDIIVTRQGQVHGVVSVRQLIESMAQFQVEVAKGSNPLTGLPGNMALEEEIEKRLELGRSFNLVYADLDHFKAYNDNYGFQYGDHMILLLSRILHHCQRRYGLDSDFMGHVGGDDFVLVTSADPERLCLGVVRCFERASRSCFTEEDRSRGWIYSTGRDCEVGKYPLVTVSLGIIQVRGNVSLHQISERAADVKKYAKSLPGNRYVHDRRSPLGQKQDV